MGTNINELLDKAEKTGIPVDYFDSDIVIIDNLKLMAKPQANVEPIKMNAITLVQQGRMQMNINGKPLEIKGNQLLVCPPGTVFSNFMISPDLELHILLLSNRIIQSFLREKMSIWNNALYVHRIRTLTPKTEYADFFHHFSEMLRFFMNAHPDNIPYRKDIMQSILRAGLLALCGTLAQRITDSNVTNNAEKGSRRSAESLFQRFLDLLSANEMKHRPVTYYADKLCVTPKYLSVVCRRASGKTAGEWITEYTMEEIRHYLRSTDLSQKQICDRLGFANLSFFGRYVRDHFGKPPGAFRKQKE